MLARIFCFRFLHLIAVVLLTPFAAQCQSQVAELNATPVHYFSDKTPSFVHKHVPDGLQIYCYNGTKYNIFAIWRSVFVQLKSAKLDYTIFVGNSVSDVMKQYEEHISKWFVVFHWQKSTINLPAFSNSCIGIEAKEPYSIHLTIRYINYWKILLLSIGIFLFFAAPTLSRNVFFHYATGVTIGVLASLLVIIYMISRAVPKKTTGIAVLTFGSSIVIYIFQRILDNARTLLQKYSTFVAGYVVTAAFVSFVICYRYGPVTERRTLHLIQWSMQLAATLMVYFSSEAREITVAILILILTAYVFPVRWMIRIKMYWLRYFPPKLRLLSEEEYLMQANEETRRSLDELRRFCRSPQCDAWKIVTRLKDPQRFASFVEGGSHLTDDEILRYDSEPCSYSYQDGEEDELTDYDDDDVIYYET